MSATRPRGRWGDDLHADPVVALWLYQRPAGM